MSPLPPWSSTGKDHPPLTDALELHFLYGHLGGMANWSDRQADRQIDRHTAVAQEVRAVVWQQEGCWFDPRAPPPPVEVCRGVPEQDTT